MSIVLDVQELRKHFPVKKGLLFARTQGSIKAVDDVSFAIEENKTLGLVGESGCGKTTTARMILLLEKLTSGSILVEGKDINRLSGPPLKRYRSVVRAVFQDPYGSLNPRMRVGSIVGEPLLLNTGLTKQDRKDRVKRLLQQVGLDSRADELYPHEFSGGQRQRIAIARALATTPKLIVLDEPVSALDVSIRAQIMNLLRDLQEQLGVAYLLIAHNLATVRYMSHQVAVMYLGKLVETGDSEEIYSHPAHPYTQALLAAALPFSPGQPNRALPLRGEISSAFNPPAGCRFHPRCLFAKPICSEGEPSLNEVTSGHRVACHL